MTRAGWWRKLAAPRHRRLQTVILLDSVAEHWFDALSGGVRRDESNARQKCMLSFQGTCGQWVPKSRRPGPWHAYNTELGPGAYVHGLFLARPSLWPRPA